MTNKIGVLLTNVGSPDQPTPSSVRHYLKQFLSDRRVVELPPILWKPLLHGIVLRVRPKKSAQLYQKIWRKEGSPLVFFSQQLAAKLQSLLNMPVAVGMHYGNPSIPCALENLRQQQVNKIVILPLYPQYSATTTAATFEQVTDVLKKWRNIPDIRFIHHYAEDENYIDAIAETIQKYSPQHLLFSFHGIPKRCVEKGDPYYDQCQLTTQRVAQKLKLASDQWAMTFQSRLGRAKWLMPYTDNYLKKLPSQGTKDLHVVCPGFAVDCLETLEEIAIRGREQFLTAGGNSFHYIPALNDTEEHLSVLKKIILKHIHGW